MKIVDKAENASTVKMSMAIDSRLIGFSQTDTHTFQWTWEYRGWDKNNKYITV